MPGLIGQHLPTGFVPNPPLGSSTLLFDNTGVLSIKRNDGSVETVGGSGSVSIDSNQISFGSPSGLTSSQYFTIDSNDGYLVFGYNSTISGGSTGSVILGGANHLIATQSQYSAIIGGICNSIIDNYINGPNAPSVSAIIAGAFNSICLDSAGSVINGGAFNKIYCYSTLSLISGLYNSISYSDKSLILGGQYSQICNSSNSSIVGGAFNTISCNPGGLSSIVGGSYNILSCYSSLSSMVGGSYNIISYYSDISSIVGGISNTISCYSNISSVIGGGFNEIDSYSNGSSVIGGCYNKIYNGSSNSVILGGTSLILNNTSDTVLAPNFWIAGSVSPNNGSNFGQSQDVFVSGFGTFSFINGIFTGITV